MEGRRVTAKYEERYQGIIPVERAASITYFTPRHREEQRAKAKSNSFEATLKKQMREVAMDENQTFQLYC